MLKLDIAIKLVNILIHTAHFLSIKQHQFKSITLQVSHHYILYLRKITKKEIVHTLTQNYIMYQNS